jgi:hypothetical protein
MAEEQNRDEYFRQRYNTELTPEQESEYQKWVAAESKTRGRDVSKDEIDYDLRGDWAKGAARDERGHGGDEFKKPNHPTFSDQSKYHNSTDDDGNTNVGGRWITDKKGNAVAFEQSNTNATHWPEWAIKDYLQKAEPGVKLQRRKDSK